MRLQLARAVRICLCALVLTGLTLASPSPTSAATHANNAQAADSQPFILPAGYGIDTILNNRARTMQAAVVAILVGIFMLRKTNYRQ